MLYFTCQWKSEEELVLRELLFSWGRQIILPLPSTVVKRLWWHCHQTSNLLFTTCPGHYDPWAYSGADLASSGLSRSSVWVFWTCSPRVLRKGASGSLVFCLVWKPSSFWWGLSGLLGQVLAPGSSQRRTAASGAAAPESWQEGWPHTCLVGQSPSPGPLPQASLSYFSSYLCLVLNILPPNPKKSIACSHLRQRALSPWNFSLSHSYGSHTLFEESVWA